MQDTTEVIDVGLLSHWKRSRSFTAKDEGAVDEQVRIDPLPEEWMAKLEEHLGDGNARVTVSQDLTTSEDYGNKAGAFVSVTVTCGNDEDNIRGAHVIARELVQELVAVDYKESKGMLDQIRGIAEAPKQNSKTQPRMVTAGKPSGRPSFGR